MSQNKLEGMTAEIGFIRRHISPQLVARIKENGTSIYDIIVEFKDQFRLPARAVLNRDLLMQAVRSNHPATVSYLEEHGIDYEPFGTNEGLAAALTADQINVLSGIEEVKMICYSPFNIEKIRDYHLKLNRERASSSLK
ncbi:hypothetical protein HYX16_05110 [Candidatus Woesearchaeota archaeon]|nr:hypothetical protein [Candidatus Woesearchaeota archaeon]